MEYSKEQEELLKKAEETKKLIAEAMELCNKMLAELEEDLEEEDEPDRMSDLEDGADWIIIF